MAYRRGYYGRRRSSYEEEEKPARKRSAVLYERASNMRNFMGGYSNAANAREAIRLFLESANAQMEETGEAEPSDYAYGAVTLAKSIETRFLPALERAEKIENEARAILEAKGKPQPNFDIWHDAVVSGQIKSADELLKRMRR